MRVVLSPSAEVNALSRSWAERLAGDRGEVVGSRAHGVSNLARTLTAAEVSGLRKAVLGLDPGDRLGAQAGRNSHSGEVLGYVCSGRQVGRSPVPTVRAVRAADHVNLAMRSPLTGPNDDELGPRFPVTAGMYATEGPAADLPAQIVACVTDAASPTSWESHVMDEQGLYVASAELCSVALVAAHLGSRILAVIVLEEDASG